MDDNLESAIRAARECNGTSYDWREAEPSPRITPREYVLAVALAAVLSLIFFPFHT